MIVRCGSGNNNKKKNKKFSMWLNDNRCGSGNCDSNDYKTRNVVY